MSKKYFVKTFGCQANKSDSERIAGDYEARGYKEARRWQEADEIVVNTCSVRQSAEDRAMGFLLNIKDTKAKIILTGCMTHYGKTKLYDLLPMVDEIMPINEVGFNSPSIRRDQHHAWVPISEGCNSFCTFCIVPYSRGREKSRSQKNILDEIKNLSRRGFTEITLLGQNVNSWGLEKVGIGFRKLLMAQKLKPEDIPSNQSQYLKPKGLPPFVSLLKAISKINKIRLIRFLTSNPWDFYDELIEEIAENPKIDRYIHLPLQSGSNQILKLMNRGYTRENYLRLVKKIKKRIPEAALGTDIIVGFPGETKKDFADTVALCKKINFKVAFVARYSPRPGTAAWRIYKDNVSHREKKRRWQILEDLINQPTLASRPKISK